MAYLFIYLILYIINDLLFNDKTYAIIGLSMEVHKILGHGFSEIVYKDAMSLEAVWRKIKTEREKEFKVEYKENILSHSFNADFVFYDNIIVEVKAQEGAINNDNVSQTLNYFQGAELA